MEHVTCSAMDEPSQLASVLVGSPLAGVVTVFLELGDVARLLAASRGLSLLESDPVIWHEVRRPSL